MSGAPETSITAAEGPGSDRSEGGAARAARTAEGGHSPLRRVADGFALACVLGATVAVGLAAAPSVARELGWTRASLSHRQRSTPPTSTTPLRNDPVLVDPDLFEPSGQRNPAYAVDDDPTFERAPPVKFAVAVRDVVVRSSADEASRSIAAVSRGELLLVVREEGEWALVAHIADDGGTTGWVRSGDLAIR